MRSESIELLKAMAEYNLAHDADCDDDEISAAFAMEEAAVKLVRIVGATDPVVAAALANFETLRTL